MTWIFIIPANGCTKKKWVLDFDIRGAFDHICWDHILQCIGNFPARELIKQWLKAGYVEVGELHKTTSGTPQGGVISPLLLNIALHGMEEILNIKYDGMGKKIRSNRALVRYADDAVVFCETKEDAQEVMMILEKWLAERGLDFSHEKTQIVHITDGFNFLGFNIRQYRSSNTQSGWKLLIKPSQESVNKIRERLRNEWKTFNGYNVETIIRRLNPIIRGQANYYSTSVASQIFSSLDHYQYNKQFHWAKRTHSKKPKRWLTNKYWRCFNPSRMDHWVFGDKNTGRYLLQYSWFPIDRHILVKGRASPDDPTLRDYWKKRLLHGCKDLEPKKKRLAQRQDGLCNVCNQSLLNGEETQIDYIVSKSRGGLATDASNLQLLHLLCKQQKTYQDRSSKVAA